MNISKKRIIEIIKEELDLEKRNMNTMRDDSFEDPEGKMVIGQLERMAKYCIELHQMLSSYGENVQLESWVQNKITIANDYVSKVKHFLENELNMSGDHEEYGETHNQFEVEEFGEQNLVGSDDS